MLLLIASAAVAQLPTGAYTIDPSAPTGGSNFQTWAAATTALSAGITGVGPTIIYVVPATYNEVVSIPTITGTTATETITFTTVGGPAVINAGGAQDGFTIAQANRYLTFENLQIQGFTRYGLYIFGAGGTANKITFCNCRGITVDAPASTSFSVNALYNNQVSDSTFENCRFLGGGNTVYSQGDVRCSFRRCEIYGKNISTRLLYPFNSNDGDNLYENCLFYGCGPAAVGLDIDVSGYGIMFWHNTIVVTTSAQAVLLAGCCAWSRSNSFRNNIVVNNGTGICMMYGTESLTSTTNPGKLDYNDLDYNVYWAPNGTAVAKQGGAGFGSGTLAAWQAYLLATPTEIIPGGGTTYDNNSIEANPGLVSAVPPFDFHLAPGSVCVDAGTSLYIAGPWVSYPVSYFPADDFEGDPRPAMGVDIGADEQTCLTARYWTNNPAATFNVDGGIGNSCSPAVTTKGQNTPTFATLLSSNIGFSFDLALVPAALVPLGGGGFTSLNGQIVNVNFLAPNLIFLNGGTLPSTASPFPGNVSLNFNTPSVAVTIGGQMVIVDPAHADGFSLSQPCQLVVL
jgi:hypothetical protein